MTGRSMMVAAMLIGAAMLGGCASYRYGPTPPGWAGEGWHRHVNRCLRRYPNYDPATDLIERRGGALRCPL